MIEVKFFANTVTDLQNQMRALLNDPTDKVTVNITGGTQEKWDWSADLVAAREKAAVDNGKPLVMPESTTPEPEFSLSETTKVAMVEARELAKAKTTEPEPTPEPTTPKVLTYAGDVTPAVNALAKVNRAKAVEVLASMGVKKATELTEKQWPEAVQKLQEALKEVS